MCCPRASRKKALGLLDKKMLKEYDDLNGSLEAIDIKRSRFNQVVAALHSIVHSLPKQPLGKNVSDTTFMSAVLLKHILKIFSFNSQPKMIFTLFIVKPAWLQVFS